MAKDTLTMPRFNMVTTIHPQKRKPVPLSTGSIALSVISEVVFDITGCLPLLLLLYP